MKFRVREKVKWGVAVSRGSNSRWGGIHEFLELADISLASQFFEHLGHGMIKRQISQNIHQRLREYSSILWVPKRGIPCPHPAPRASNPSAELKANHDASSDRTYPSLQERSKDSKCLNPTETCSDGLGRANREGCRGRLTRLLASRICLVICETLRYPVASRRSASSSGRMVRVQTSRS